MSQGRGRWGHSAGVISTCVCGAKGMGRNKKEACVAGSYNVQPSQKGNGKWHKYG